VKPDLNDTLRNGGEEAVRERLSKARPFPYDEQAKKSGKAKSDPLGTIDASIWEERPVPPRVWTVENLIPSRNVTLLNGNGGIGKTLLSLQLAASAASHGYWLALATRPGRTLGVFCEDEQDELHRRLVDIAASMNVSAVLAPPFGSGAEV